MIGGRRPVNECRRRLDILPECALRPEFVPCILVVASKSCKPAVSDIPDVDGMSIQRLFVALAVPGGEYDAMPVVCQHVFNL